MAIDNLVNNMHAANIRIASSMDYLDNEEQSIITGIPSYESDKAKAAAEFLNNFYYKLPGGFLIELISRAIEAWEETGKDTLLRREMLREYKPVAEDVRHALLDSELQGILS